MGRGANRRAKNFKATSEAKLHCRVQDEMKMMARGRLYVAWKMATMKVPEPTTLTNDSIEKSRTREQNLQSQENGNEI